MGVQVSISLLSGILPFTANRISATKARKETKLPQNKKVAGVIDRFIDKNKLLPKVAYIT